MQNQQDTLIGKTLFYKERGKMVPVKVLMEDDTHVLVEFLNGIKLCTNKNTFSGQI